MARTSLRGWKLELGQGSQVPHLLGRALGLWLHLMEYDNTATQHSGLAWTRPGAREGWGGGEGSWGGSGRAGEGRGEGTVTQDLLSTAQCSSPHPVSTTQTAQLHLRPKLPYT